MRDGGELTVKHMQDVIDVVFAYSNELDIVRRKAQSQSEVDALLEAEIMAAAEHRLGSYNSEISKLIEALGADNISVLRLFRFCPR